MTACSGVRNWSTVSVEGSAAMPLPAPIAQPASTIITPMPRLAVLQNHRGTPVIPEWAGWRMADSPVTTMWCALASQRVPDHLVLWNWVAMIKGRPPRRPSLFNRGGNAYCGCT
uniref:Uncharacterized protein n=1 Tax=blood disease bacterium R229 TaxID=741978 RepID=G2ZSW2_9RALS|nr:hypothetical protein BDB_180168 [blood disease bacterium R229]